MTHRERVLYAILHKETDFIPYQIGLTMEAHEHVVSYTGDNEYYNHIGNHIAMYNYDAHPRVIDNRNGYWRDDFGVIWNRNGADKDIGVIEKPLISENSLANYVFPEIDEKLIRREMEAVIAGADDKCKLAAISFTMFERAWTLRGMENLLMDMLTEPEFVADLYEHICEHVMSIVRIALSYPFDGIHFGDDWGQQKGLIMGPRCWRDYIKSVMAKLFSEVKNAGKFVSLHSCGDIEELLPDLIDIGLDVYQTFQPEIYDVKTVKRNYGANLAFWGGISTQRVLPYASPEEVKQIAQEIMSIMGAGGGYIAAPTHAVPGDVPPQNIVALVEVFQSQVENKQGFVYNT